MRCKILLPILYTLFLTFANVFSVRQCYLCNGECSTPTAIDNCYNHFPANETTECVSRQIMNKGSLEITKRCITDRSAQICMDTNEFEMQSCYTCSAELCNKVENHLGSSNWRWSLLMFTLPLSIVV